MVSYISIFCHVYLLTSLLEPTATLNITICFFHQLEFMNDRTHIKGLKAIDAAGALIQIVSSTIILLVRIFVLLWILLIISVVELYFAKSQQSGKITTTLSTWTVTTAEIKKKDNDALLASSPLLLPTPPCEKEDVPIPTKMSDSPISNHDDDVVRPAKETKVITAPNEPAPLAPAPPDEATSKQQKQQTTENTNQDDVNYSEQPSIENTTIQLDQQTYLPDIQKSSSSTIVTSVQHKIESDKNSLIDSTHILPPSNSLPTSSSSLSSPSSDDSILQASLLKEAHEKTKDSNSDMPDHIPNNFPTKHRTKLSPEGYKAIKAIQTEAVTEEEKEDKNDTPVSVPLLSPSGSLSSSLSTLNHITNSNSQEKSTTQSEDQSNVSRLHRSFLKNQQQKQQQQHLEELESSSSPFPVLSHSSRTHMSTVPTTPTPLGSSLSMKLSKLKKPGRRISQMFKKKNKQ